MFKTHLSLLLIAIFSLIINQAPSLAAIGHEISDLAVITSPKNATVGVAVRTLIINFNLKAQTGIDVNRIRILFDNGAPGFVVSANDFTVTRDEEDKPDIKASISYVTEDVIFPQASTNIKVIYCLTSVNCNDILASAAINKLASGSSSGTGGGNSGGGTGNGDNGSTGATQIPRVFYLDVDEVSNGDEGMVSTQTKQFKLTITHNTQFLDKVTQDNFNANTNPILANLKISSTNTFTGERMPVTDDYSFSLNGASIDSTERPGFVITKYISDNQLIKTGQKLKFNIDLQDFFERFGIVINNGAIIQADKTISIEPLIGSMSDIIVDPSALSFSNNGTAKGKTNYISDLVNIKASLVSDDNPSTVSNVEFFRLNKAKTKIKPKLSINSTKQLTIKPSVLGTAGISSNGDSFTINIPVNLETSAKEKTLVKQGFNIPSKTKTLKIPMIITTKTVDGLDLIFTDTFNDPVETNFAITIAANGNSL